jgi:hypothetical protein
MQQCAVRKVFNPLQALAGAHHGGTAKGSEAFIEQPMANEWFTNLRPEAQGDIGIAIFEVSHLE